MDAMDEAAERRHEAYLVELSEVAARRRAKLDAGEPLSAQDVADWERVFGA